MDRAGRRRRLRRVVASPLPQGIIELETARTLLDGGTTVVLAGGGGVPVVEGPHGLAGVEAVVDKDYVAALIAAELQSDLLVLLTDVDGVMTDCGTPQQRLIREVRADELQAVDFPAGSMGPKVSAACRFVQNTGKHAAIGALGAVSDVISGAVGTQIRRTCPASFPS